MNDPIFNEVDEEVRRDQMIALTKRYGPWAGGVALIIVLFVAGYNILGAMQESAMEEESTAYEDALALSLRGDIDSSVAAFAGIAEGSTGYATLSELRQAAILGQEGEVDRALAVYDALADSGVEDEIKDLASLHAGYLLLDAGRNDEAAQRLGRLSGSDTPFRLAADELLAFISLQSGELDDAESRLIGLINDPDTPQSMRTRANEFLEMVDQTRLRMAPVDVDNATEDSTTEGQE